MRAERLDANRERSILTAMIVNRIVCARIAARWDGRMFRNDWSNLIGGWCVDYVRRYGRAPRGQIQTLFTSWAEDHPDDKVVQLVERFLEELSDDYKQTNREINPDHMTDMAGDYFTRVRLERLADSIQGDLSVGRPDEAEKRVVQWGSVRLGRSEWVDVLSDEDAMREALDQDDTEVLVRYPGALGQFWGDALERDGFIALEGPEKRGKTFWLLDIAFRAAIQRRRVAFFEAGDMSRRQIMRRFLTRIARAPRKPGKILYPISIERDENSEVAAVECEEREFKSRLSWRRAAKAARQIRRRRIHSQDSFLRLSVHPGDLTVETIHDICLGWEREDWVPDVIVIDYADLLEHTNGRLDRRDQINDIWRRLRGLSQLFHCLVLTATQTDSKSYNVNTIGRQNFSEDKRKHAHVTGIVGLNQTIEEREQVGAMRLNWVLRRESAYQETRCVHVAYCLPIANMAVRSCW